METPPVYQHLIAGTAGGVIATAGTYPLELVKTRMQVIEGTNSAYNNFFSASASILRKEGVAGFYKGIAPAMIGASGSWGGYFYFYELSKVRKLDRIRSEGKKLQVIDHLQSGVEAGVALVIIFNPVWLIKTRLAVQDAQEGVRRYSGLRDAVKTIYREEGFLGFYKGLLPALLLTSHGAIQFAAYEQLKTSAALILEKDVKDQAAWVSVSIGGMSKVLASTVTYPYQLIKSKLQQGDAAIVGGASDSIQQFKAKYSGTLDCIVKVWRNEGIKGFFRGAIPNAFKVAPSSAVTFLVYEECLKLMKS